MPSTLEQQLPIVQRLRFAVYFPDDEIAAIIEEWEATRTVNGQQPSQRDRTRVEHIMAVLQSPRHRQLAQSQGWDMFPEGEGLPDMATIERRMNERMNNIIADSLPSIEDGLVAHIGTAMRLYNAGAEHHRARLRTMFVGIRENILDLREFGGGQRVEMLDFLVFLDLLDAGREHPVT